MQCAKLYFLIFLCGGIFLHVGGTGSGSKAAVFIIRANKATCPVNPAQNEPWVCLQRHTKVFRYIKTYGRKFLNVFQHIALNVMKLCICPSRVGWLGWTHWIFSKKKKTFEKTHNFANFGVSFNLLRILFAKQIKIKSMLMHFKFIF